MIAYHDDDHDGIWQALLEEADREKKEKKRFYRALVYACIDVALDTRDRDWFLALSNLMKTMR